MYENYGDDAKYWLTINKANTADFSWTGNWYITLAGRMHKRNQRNLSAKPSYAGSTS